MKEETKEYQNTLFSLQTSAGQEKTLIEIYRMLHTLCYNPLIPFCFRQKNLIYFLAVSVECLAYSSTLF